MQKVLFLDRDGVLLQEPAGDYQVDSFEKFALVPGVLSALQSIWALGEYKFVMVTNQDGLGTDCFPENTFWGPHNLLLDILGSEGIVFSDIFIDRSFPHEGMPTRKPGVGMLTKYIEGDYDLSGSLVIGDRFTDMLLAQNLGAKGIMIGKSLDANEDSSTLAELGEDTILGRFEAWEDIASFVRSQNRAIRHRRVTNETSIDITLDLDGSGRSKISTGLSFFDHMLEQLARHGGVDLDVLVKGDLHIDEHHTIEDTALALGEAFRQALGTKRGIERYGFMLPMDECEANVSLDFGGRPWLIWEAQFRREYVGDMPTEMFHHFFKSFSDASLCNLHIRVSGENEHHKIESIFKAWARAIKMAIRRDTERMELPSTKGVL